MDVTWPQPQGFRAGSAKATPRPGFGLHPGDTTPRGADRMEPSQGQEPEAILIQASPRLGTFWVPNPSLGCEAHCPGLIFNSSGKSPSPQRQLVIMGLLLLLLL